MMAIGPLYAGEVRFVRLSFAGDPAIVAGATLASAAAISILEKRGEADVSDDVVLGAATDPVRADPIIAAAGTAIDFWAIGYAPGRYVVEGQALGSNNEIIKARDILLVE